LVVAADFVGMLRKNGEGGREGERVNLKGE